VVSVDRSRHVPKIKYIRIKKYILYTITPRDPVAGNYHENITLTLNTGGGGGGVKSTAAGIRRYNVYK